MSDVNYPRIVTFKEYCQSKRKLSEGNCPNIKVEVGWWDEAICTVMDELHRVAGEPIEWDTLLNYCRNKFLVLSREIPFLVDDIALAHIRDLVFRYYGSVLFTGDGLSGQASYKSEELGTRILVVTQLGDEILNLVKTEAGLLPPPEVPDDSPNTVASVSLDGGYDEDDIPFESKEVVYDYGKFTKLLNEAFTNLQFDHYNSVIDACLKDLEDVASGLKYDKVLKAAKKKIKGKDEKDTIDEYLTDLVEEHMKNAQVTVEGVDVNDLTPSKIDVIKAAKQLFMYSMVEELKGRITR